MEELAVYNPIPNTLTLKTISIDEIKEKFKLKYPKYINERYLISKIINIYFNYKVNTSCKIGGKYIQIIENRKKITKYKTDLDFIDIYNKLKDILKYNKEKEIYIIEETNEIEEYSDVCELTHDPCETSENNKIKMSNGKYEEYYSDSDVDIDTIDSEIEEEYRHKRLNIKRNLKK